MNYWLKIIIVNIFVCFIFWWIFIYNYEKEHELIPSWDNKLTTLELWDLTVTENDSSWTGIIIQNDYKSEIEVAFLGDVMIWWRVKDAMYKHGQSYVFSGSQEFLSKKDAVILNLETPVTEQIKKINKTYTFKADKKHLEWLKSFNDHLVVNLANNHIWDFTNSWVIDTLDNLNEYKIPYFWAGKNKLESDKVFITEVEWVKIALIGQTCVNPLSFRATETTPWNSWFNKEVLKQEIDSARTNWVDIVVFNMHCGAEYTNWPNKIQKEFAYFAIDNWVDLVIWHHPHWYQPIEIYKNKMIFYSLWDYIFDIFRGRRTQEWIIANIKITDKKITWAEIIPSYTQWFWNTVISNETKARFALNELYEISKKLWDIPSIKDWFIILE